MSDPDSANTEYAFSYEFDSHAWAGSLWASTWEEAEMKLKAIANGKIDGVLKGTVPADQQCPTCGHETEPDA